MSALADRLAELAARWEQAAKQLHTHGDNDGTTDEVNDECGTVYAECATELRAVSTAPGPTAETAMVAGLLGMLERRERTAQKAYRECDAAVERAERDHGYLDSRAVAERARRLYASSRWTEAQEALAEARRIATTLTV